MTPINVRAYRSGDNQITMLGSYYLPIKMVYNAVLKMYPASNYNTEFFEYFFYVVNNEGGIIEGLEEGKKDTTPSSLEHGNDDRGFEKIPGHYVDPGCNDHWTKLVAALDKLQDARNMIDDDDSLPILDI